MGKKLIEVILPFNEKNSIQEMLNKFDLKVVWFEQILEDKLMVGFLIAEEKTDPLIDKFEEKYGKRNDFNLFILSLAASLPKEIEPGEALEHKNGKKQKIQESTSRVSREELYENAEKNMKLNLSFILLIILSSIIAASGIFMQDTMTIIGAAMIAPILGPNISFAFSVAVGDSKLMKNSLKSILIGVFLSLLISVLIGLLIKIKFPDKFLTSTDVMMGLSNVIVSLAAGTAGALAFSTGLSTMLVGVVVSIAILPPLVKLGMVLGEAQWHLAWKAFLIIMVNLICINLTGVATFFLQDIRSSEKKEERKAKKSSYIGITIWLILLVFFTLMLIFYNAKS